MDEGRPPLLARLHWWLRHRHPMVSCVIHCGCDCDGLPCKHTEFRALPGFGRFTGEVRALCAHCGFDQGPMAAYSGRSDGSDG